MAKKAGPKKANRGKTNRLKAKLKSKRKNQRLRMSKGEKKHG